MDLSNVAEWLLTPELLEPGRQPQQPTKADSTSPQFQGLLAYYPLITSGENTLDLVTGFQGTLFNGPALLTTDLGRSLSFLRASSQYVSCQVPPGISTMSFSILARRAANNDNGAFFKIGNRTDTATGGDGLACGVGGTGTTGFETAGNRILILYEGVRWIDTGVDWPSNEIWHQIDLDVNTSGHPSLYLNGALIYSDTVGAPATIGSSGVAVHQIGGYLGAGGENRYAQASLSNYKFWNRARGAGEITRQAQRSERWALLQAPPLTLFIAASGGQTMTPAQAIATAVGGGATLTPGAVSITPTQAIGTAVGGGATLTPGTVTLSPAQAIATAVGGSATLTPGAVSLTPTQAIATAIGGVATLTSGQLLTPSAAIATAFGGVLTLTNTAVVQGFAIPITIASTLTVTTASEASTLTVIAA